MDRFRFEIQAAWDGAPLRAGEGATIELCLGDELELAIDASFHADPPPPGPPGRCDGLWEFEVVELFLLGADEQYLEVELGPHGHWLALSLAGRRHVVASDLVLSRYETRRQGDRWSAHAALARDRLPPGLVAANAYAIHGLAPARRYLAWRPVPGPTPDFHRLEHFAPLAAASQRVLSLSTG